MTRLALATVVTCYDKAAFIADAVASAKAQGDPVIAVDDASTDGSREILAATEGIETVLLETNGGVTAATIAGLERARALGADRVTLLDGDDVLAPRANAYYRDVMARTGATAVYSEVARSGGADRRPEAVAPPEDAAVETLDDPFAAWLVNTKGTTAVCAAPDDMLADLVPGLRYQDHQIGYSIHRNAERVAYSAAVTHYCSAAAPGNLSRQWRLRHVELMKFYRGIYPQIAGRPDTRALAGKIRRYTWKTALRRTLGGDPGALPILLRALANREADPQRTERDAAAILARLGA